jgi:hypothetical protein
MKALTIFPECLWAIQNLGKDVENRGWVPTKDVYPTEGTPYPLALHAGMRIGGVKGRGAERKALQIFVDVVNRTGLYSARLRDLSAISYEGMGIWAYFVDRHTKYWLDSSIIDRGAIVAVTHIWRVTKDSNSPWAMPGHHHWCLGKVINLHRPIPCKGRQRLWTVPKDIEARIKEQLREVA